MREFLQLAKTFRADKHGVAGWYLSEKLDGMRCFWDGGVTRGLAKRDVPWANLNRDRQEQMATGLWSRYGNVIHAPNWFLDKLPKCPLDGELYHKDRSYRQELMSIVKKLVPDEKDWEAVTFMIFDVPPPAIIFANGQINNPNHSAMFTNLEKWFRQDLGISTFWDTYKPQRWENYYRWMTNVLNPPEDLTYQIHTHIKLPNSTPEALQVVYKSVDEIATQGGEGVMLRDPNAIYQIKRSPTLLKLKPCDDAEAVVIGFKTGLGKLRGLFGSVIVNNGHVTFELSGFTDAERQLTDEKWAWDHPGQEVPPHVDGQHIHRGSTITYKYRGTTRDGYPQEARYWRRNTTV